MNGDYICRVHAIARALLTRHLVALHGGPLRQPARSSTWCGVQRNVVARAPAAMVEVLAVKCQSSTTGNDV